MELTEFRALFPGVREQVYLDVSLRGLVPTAVAQAGRRHLDERLLGTGDKAAFQRSVERSRELMADMLGAHPDEVSVTKNVSEGLNVFASSLPWREGDNVVLCPDLEHPNNVFLWYNLKKLHGIEVRAVEPEAGHFPHESVERAMDDRTRVVTVPHVSFSPGFVSEVRRTAEVAHARGALVVVDAAQSVGALVTRVEALGADALAVATQKCLLALYGYGFLYVRRDVAEALTPRHVARYGMDLGVEAGETARAGGEDLPFARGARRFDLGNYNYLGARAAEASLALLLEVGVDRIEDHVRGLAADLARGFLELGLPVAGGEPGPHLAHIVAVGESGGGHHDTADDPVMNELHAHLMADGVRHSIRKGVLRFSVGAYNDAVDIARTLESAGRWVVGRDGPRGG
jgi:cysteine desulfurase/selenocysteine lyase